MPQLDRKNARNGALGVRVDAGAGRFYDGSTPDRTLVRCPKCRREMDPLFPHDESLPDCVRLEHETAAVVAAFKASVPKGRGGMEATHGR